MLLEVAEVNANDLESMPVAAEGADTIDNGAHERLQKINRVPSTG